MIWALLNQNEANLFLDAQGNESYGVSAVKERKDDHVLSLKLMCNGK